MSTAFEREEQALEDELASGQITQAEFHEQMRDLERDYRDAAHEAAQDAYDRELEDWFA